MDRHQVDKEIVTALCANGIPFNVLINPQFCRMISVINNAPKGYKPPSFEKARTSLLDDVKTSVEKELMPVKDTWYTGGLSIVSDGWSNVKKESLINILAGNSRGAIFLYAENCAGVEKTGMDNMLGEIKDAMRNNKYGDKYERIEKIVIDRWAKMNFAVHSLGFALCPRFYDPSYLNTPAPGGMARKRPNEDK
ncbi:hypothetical protein COLO4_27211 [Corchorus olitorius]|uniref:DUF659 domain-containing protein n=1 Tax=Corchorus olitorius TaxID=93759 RepID=A0A1R3HS59_9ROSI|nr:hypothetical protein COLO4_27211 [Corchorus olitorius]